METEIWKDIPGLEGKYQASSHGRIRSLDRYVDYHCGDRCYRRLRKGRIIRLPARDRTGHLGFHIGHIPKVYAHQIIASAFLGPCPEGMMVLHNNGDPADNRPENLRFGTAADNDHDIYRQGGKRHKLDLRDVEGIRFGVYCGHTDKELAWNFGVDRTMINRIRNRKRYGWCEI